jgi:hypothetical protein
MWDTWKKWHQHSLALPSLSIKHTHIETQNNKGMLHMFQGDVSSTLHIYMFHMLHWYVLYVSLVCYICSMLIYEPMMFRLMQCKCQNVSLTPRVLHRVVLQQEVQDHFRWKLTQTGTYSRKSAYETFFCWFHKICSMAQNLAELGTSTLQILHLVGIKRKDLDGWSPSQAWAATPRRLFSVWLGTGNSPAPSFIMRVHSSGLVFHFPISEPGRWLAHGWVL